ncbi:MAG: glutamate-5-semialdehyde dehydrogenase [candidate division NC10 bacterium]|nr:glutamate-5-semialdehyde dehydrogenase [candidate division NC10 bacterium]
MSPVVEVARAAKEAAAAVATLPTELKNAALRAMAAAVRRDGAHLVGVSAAEAARAKAAGHPAAFLDRLTLTPGRIRAMAEGLEAVAGLPDPVGEITGMRRRPNGLLVGRMRVPLGVIAVIYESRPNVTADVAGLCLKAGNAVVLRGGSEALETNGALAALLTEAAVAAGVPKGALGFIASPDRAAVAELARLDRYIDCLIPRGGEDLIRAVKAQATVPVLAHEKGLCHTYVDAAADLGMAAEVAFNAKVERPGVCNAMETLLVHEAVAPAFLPPFVARLRAAGVEVRGCPRTAALVPAVAPATEADWDTEYLDLILAVRVVASYEEAVAHIRRHGTGLAEAVVTADYATALRFLRDVDAGAVFVNASTRFTDGGELGLGAEMGVSTQKLHARGPVGLAELTCTKFIVLGEGQVRRSAK